MNERSYDYTTKNGSNHTVQYKESESSSMTSQEYHCCGGSARKAVQPRRKNCMYIILQTAATIRDETPDGEDELKIERGS
jgi:hypothetical protein